VLVYVLHSEPDSLDPHVTYRAYSHNVMMQIFDTLVWQAPDYSYQPGLATSWEISPDGMTYTFHLRSGITFHDGTPFNAEAAHRSFQRIVNPETKSRYAVRLMRAYESSRALDKLTLEIRLKEPSASFLSALCESFIGMVSPAAVERWGPEFGRHPVGTGPFVFASWEPGSEIRLRPNLAYQWTPPGFRHNGPPYLEEVTFRIWEHPPAEEMLAKADIVQIFPRECDLDQLRADRRFFVRSDLVPGIPEGLIVNASRPPCDERTVRRAIAYAINAAEIVKRVHKGEQTLAYGPLSPASRYYDPRVEVLFPYNPERARALLEEAGWVLRPGSSVREKEGRTLTLGLFIHDGDELLAEIVHAQLAQVGIQVCIDLRSDRARADACLRGEHHIANTGWQGNDAAVLDYLFQSAPNATGIAWTHHGDAHLDELLARGRQELNEQTRHALYSEIQHYILEEGYFVPLYNVSSVLLVRHGVEGFLVDRRALYVWLYDAQKKTHGRVHRRNQPESATRSTKETE
jgi:peptide/nickel transport system substrate-binding protein